MWREAREVWVASAVDTHAGLFAIVLGDPRQALRCRRWKKAALMTAVGIVQGLGLAVLCFAVALPSPPPEPPDPLVVLIYDPPPAAPLPRPEGSKVTVEVARSTPGQPVVEEPRRAKLGAPMQATAEMPEEIELEPAASPKDKAGDETGSDRGDPLGMEAGVDNGMVGGVPEGKVGGVPGGTGTAPVLNYDTPPRIIRQTRPRYPQEAFVKKVEGTVVVEIVIDPSGRVSRARVIQSVPLLDAAAIETVHEWLFQPAVKRGRLVPAIGRAPVRFVIY